MRSVPKKIGFFVFSLCFIGVFFAFRASAEEIPKIYDPNIAQSPYPVGSTAIEGLVWAGESGKPEFTVETLGDGKPAARLKGRFMSKNAGTLLISSSNVQRVNFTDDSGNFAVLIPITGRKTPLNIRYIDDYGNKKTLDIELVYEDFYQFQLTQQTKKKWNFDGGASFSYLDFTQTAASTDVKISQIGLTPKFGVTYNATSKLDIGGSIFGTAIGVPTQKSPAGLSTPRFYGVNMRIGYRIYGLTNGNIYLMTGPYFWGMIIPASANGLTYGVVKLSGPQLFLVGRFLTGEGRTAVGYLKAASILDGYGGMTNNHEFAIGAAYQITPPKAKRRVMMNVDLASASFQVLDQATGEVQGIKLNSISVGLSTPL